MKVQSVAWHYELASSTFENALRWFVNAMTLGVLLDRPPPTARTAISGENRCCEKHVRVLSPISALARIEARASE